MENKERIEFKIRVHKLWCQHCKALQKSNDTVVECWYNPLDHDGMDKAFCAASIDAVESIIPIIQKGVVDILKNYGISITEDGIVAPYTDEWDYLYDKPRTMLLKGNDKGQSAKSLWQTLEGKTD